MMNSRELTFTEQRKMRDITMRLRCLSSPVLKLQALLQFSQIVDMLALGDTSAERIQELIDEVDEADAAYANLKEECGIVEDDEKFNETSN